MLKFGICTLDDLDRARPIPSAPARRRFRRFCDIELYEALARRGWEGDEDLQAEVLDLFPIANGAYKRTGRMRFGAFDREVADLLSERFAGIDRLVVHDMAVSDARTSCDLHRLLSERFGGRLGFFATDACIRVSGLSAPGEGLVVVVDEDGVPLQLVRPPFVLPIAQKESWLYPVNRWLRHGLMGRARRLMAAARAGDPGVVRRDIVLLCREARAHLESRTDFTVERHDLFAAAPRSYHVVRSMNVLNPSYFTEARLALAVRHVHASLHEGGVFVVGSNGDVGSAVDGGMYERRGERLIEVRRWGSGPAIARLLEAHRAAAGRAAPGPVAAMRTPDPHGG